MFLYVWKQTFRTSKMRISQKGKGVIMRNLHDTNFYMKINVLQYFHICISVPLSIFEWRSVCPIQTVFSIISMLHFTEVSGLSFTQMWFSRCCWRVEVSCNPKTWVDCSRGWWGGFGQKLSHQKMKCSLGDIRWWWRSLPGKILKFVLKVPTIVYNRLYHHTSRFS